MKLLNEFAIQLYSVRDAMENNFVGVLEKLGCKGMGYTGVEFAGFGGLSADEMKKALDENGLKPIASHTGTDQLLNSLDDVIAYHKTIGAEYIICPYAEMKSKAGVIELAQKLKPAAEKITAAGLKFGYHNHDQEFAMEDGEYLMDIFFDNMPDNTILELDIFWSEYAGVDSLAYMEKHKNRLELLHIKQISKDKRNVDIEDGIIDFADIIKKSKVMGVRHFIMEQEEYDVSSMVSAENNVKYILSL